MITPDQIISLDPYLIAIVSKNVITIGFVLGILKGWAKVTPGVIDDKICTLLVNAFSSLMPGKKQEVLKTQITEVAPESNTEKK